MTFPELGHLLFWEDPDGFADAVAAFLLARDLRAASRRHPVEPPSRYPVVVAGDEVVGYLGDLGLQGLFGVPAYPRRGVPIAMPVLSEAAGVIPQCPLATT